VNRCAVVAVLVTLLTAGPAAADAGSSPLSVRTSHVRISTRLGDKFRLRTTVVNDGPTAERGLIAHLNIVGLDPSVYVDPEDWSSHRTSYLRTLRPGESTTITWRLQAVSAGAFDVYVAVFRRAAVGGAPTTGQAVLLSVHDRRTLSAGGILPLSLGVPAFLAALALGIRLRRRH
jgi:hypothetical protein